MKSQKFKHLTNVAVALCAIALLSACLSTPIKREFNREGEPLTITITVYKGKRAFLKAAKKPAPGLYGEATYSLSDNRCDIIIKSTGTNLVDGVFTQSIGHEVMHCLYGDYHGEHRHKKPIVIYKEE